MTVKSPFYNKPSTSTSVDSCHKCPSISAMPVEEPSTALRMSPAVENPLVQQQAQTCTSGFEASVSQPSNKTHVLAPRPGTLGLDPSSSRATSSDNGSNCQTSCSNCGTTVTPLWRRSPQGATICNACGLYLKARNTTRPPWLKRKANKRPLVMHTAPIALAPAPIAAKLPIQPTPAALHPMPPTANTTTIASAPATPPASDSDASSTTDDEAGASSCSADGRAMTCFNCSTTTTPLWRRDGAGNTICNACGLYYKLHNVHRPITMKRSIIKRRKRVAVPATMTAHHHHYPVNVVAAMPAPVAPVAPAKRNSEQIDPLAIPAPKRMHLPVVAKSPSPDPVEPDAFHRSHHLPSPPLQPIKSKLADLLNPSSNDDQHHQPRTHRLPSMASLPGLPSPPMIPDDTMHPRSVSPPPTSTAADQNTSNTNSTSTNSSHSAVAAAAFATVSALLNPTANRKHTQQMLQAHRHELQREVSHLTSMLTRTTAMLENLDQVMAVTNDAPKARSDAIPTVV
ncbi:hypothetical protein BC940DRAFT_266206 [Gongronella butleri]|nr:hypothetical protein BC940DRAFT_266206 [Gongronella butleri]